MYLLDTNVVSELRRPKPHGGVVSWLHGVTADSLWVAAVTFAELQAGVEITREQDAEKAAMIEAWIDRVAESHAVLPMDGRTFRLWAQLMHHRSDDLIEDAMIAATAIVHDLIVVTRNVRDFRGFSVRTFDPFAIKRK